MFDLSLLHSQYEMVILNNHVVDEVVMTIIIMIKEYKQEINEKTHHAPDLKIEALNDVESFPMYHLNLHIIVDSVYS